MGQGQRIVEFAKAGNLKGGVTELKRQAQDRGHGQQTALAGAGGLAGAVLGSFRGPFGAAIGALLGAFLGALFGASSSRAPTGAAPSRSPRRWA